MSAAVLVRRDAHGVLLRYRTDVRGPHHTELRIQPSDRLRVAVLKAEKQLRILEIIAEHLEISEVATERVEFALRTIDVALASARHELGMCTEAEDA